jgi:hypothetical protein
MTNLGMNKMTNKDGKCKCDCEEVKTSIDSAREAIRSAIESYRHGELDEWELHLAETRLKFIGKNCK